jgi:hypothetical protein
MTDNNEPYTVLHRIVDAVFNFLTAVGVIAFAGIAGYLWSKYL